MRFADMVVEQLPEFGAFGATADELRPRLGLGLRPLVAELRRLEREGRVVCRVGDPSLPPARDASVARWTQSLDVEVARAA